MTDLERLRELLNSWEVPFHEYDWDVPQPRNVTEEERPWHPKLHALTVGGLGYEWDSVKIDGYGGFFTQFEFTPDGKFVRMGAWE